MTLPELIQRYGLEFIGRYYSTYRAVVLDNQDPENLGDIEVMIPSIHDGVQAWAKPKNSIGGGVNHGYKYLTPKPGDIVWVEFENGDPLRPVWSYIGWGENECPEELKDTNTLGIITPKGNKIYLKEVDGELYLKINTSIDVEITGGTKIHIDKESSEITINGDDGSKSIYIDGDIVKVNGGNNGGVLNIEQFNTLIQALSKDLAVAMSGQNLAQWMATDLPLIEDKKFTH